jgi:hypothetical protein
MEQELLIPTSYKSKVPQTHSFPAGAKNISTALIGVPQFARIELNFGFYNRKSNNQESCFSVIKAGYSKLSVSPHANNNMLALGTTSPNGASRYGQHHADCDTSFTNW